MKTPKTPFFYYLLVMLAACGQKVELVQGPLYVPDDLEVTVWASTPQFFNPTNMDVDARGRVWVTEAVNYRDFRNADGHMVQEDGDRIIILEDSNGDGKADTSKVFVQDPDLRAPLGIAVLGKQVVVSCSPSVIVYTDEDGDDIPDRKEVFLTGFGGKDHDHGLHAGVVGPDGKWYFITGNAGPHQINGEDGWTLRAGSVYNEYTPYSTENIPSQISDDGKIYTGGLVIRINPDGTGMEVMSHNFRNAFEVSVDSFGNMWQSDNDDQTASCRTTWLTEGSNAGFFSKEGDRTWQADRRPGQTIVEAHWHQHDPGVLPSGDIYGAGSPTGIVRIEGDELGEQYRGLLLSADAGRNVIFGYQPRLEGSGYVLQDRKHFITSVDEDNINYIWHEIDDDDRKWFRPSDVAVGTDGSLFVADWYDPIVGGHQMRDTVGYGKIYRIAPKNKKTVLPEIDLSNLDGQMKALLNPAIHVRAQAAQALLAHEEQAIPALRELLQNPNPFYRARAVWLLAQMGKAGNTVIQPLLYGADPEIALTTVRALAAFQPELFLELAPELVVKGHMVVKRALAILLRDADRSNIRSTYIDLIRAYDGQDPWYLNALGTSLRGRSNAYEWIKEAYGQPEDLVWPAPMAKLVWETSPLAAVGALEARLQSTDLSPSERKLAMETLAFIPDSEAAGIMLSFAENESGQMAEQALWWLQFRKHNEWRDYLEDWESPVDLMPAAQPGLLALKEILMDSLSTPEEILEAANDLSADPTGRLQLALLASLGQVPEGISEHIRADLEGEERPAVKKLLDHYFTNAQTANKNETQIAAMEAEYEVGRVKAAQNCLACHKIGPSGNELGPDLSQIHLKMDRNTLINAIISPDAAVAFGAEAFLVGLKNGAVLYGLLQSGGPVVTVLDSQNKQHQIPAGEIVSRKQLPFSLMPYPAHMALEDQDVADITAYLLRP